MKIVIDGRMLYWTGVGRYTKALLDNLEVIDQANEYVVLRRPADAELWKPTARNFTVIDADINPYSIGEQTRLAKVVGGLKPGLTHFVAANAPVAYSGNRVVTVHDFTLLKFDTSRGSGVGRMARKLKRIPFRSIVSLNVRTAPLLIAPSQFVKGELESMFRVNPGKVRVTLLAADASLADPAPLDRLKLPEEFILFVGTAYPYKNAGLIIEALNLLRYQRPDLALVITARHDYFRDILAKQAHQLGLEKRVIFTDFVSDGELVSLYRKALLYVYPSVSEGFGLQGLEAMAQGLPVLASRASSLPEVCGNAAEYFDPHSAQDLAGKINALLGDSVRMDELRRLGEKRFREFSWRATAEQTRSVYRELGAD